MIHIGELGAGAVERAEMQRAIEDVADEFNRVGGISTSVESDSTTYDPFVT